MVAAPLVASAAGFTAAGITAGSLGATMMSYSATTQIGGAVVAALQSVGAAGVGWKAAAAGADAGRRIAKKVEKVINN